jgi:hypothetical protein
MIAQRGAAHASDFGFRRRPLAPRGLLVSAEASKRIRSKFRVACRHLPYQFEKQRQRARCAFMLQRTMLR